MNTRMGPAGYALAFTAGLVAVFAVGLLWARAAVVSENGFTANVVQAAEDEAVQQEIADIIVRQMIEAEPVLRPSRPILQRGAEAAINTRAFREGIFKDAVRTLHRTAFDESRQRLVLDLTALVDLIVAEVDGSENQFDVFGLQLDSNAGEVAIEDTGTLRSGARFANRADVLAPWMPLLAAALLAAGVLIGRWHVALAVFAGGVTAAALLTWFALLLVRSGVSSRLDDDTSRASADALWQAFLPPLPTALIALSLVAVVAAAAGVVAHTLIAGRQARRYSPADEGRYGGY